MKRLAAVTLAAAAACQPAAVPPQIAADVDYIHLTTELPSYPAGAEATLVLTNPTQDEYGYNLCVSRLERREQDRWVEIRPMLAEACTMELRLLGPGASARFTFQLDPEARPGEYRVRTNVEEMATGERLELTSATFTVTS